MLNVVKPVALAVALALCAGVAHADTLLVDRVKQQPQQAVPQRGMSMSQVEARFGAPSQRMDPRGGQKRQWPTINRWVYPGFTGYFEKSRVIDVVVNQVAPTEVGPKPVGATTPAPVAAPVSPAAPAPVVPAAPVEPAPVENTPPAEGTEQPAANADNSAVFQNVEGENQQQ